MTALPRHEDIVLKKKLRRLLFPCAGIILCASLESLMTVKDASFYESWKASGAAGNFNDFVTMNSLLYLAGILFPLVFGLYTAMTLRRFGTPPLYRMVWGTLGTAALAAKALELRTSSIFYYLILVLYILLIYRIFTADHPGMKASTPR